MDMRLKRLWALLARCRIAFSFGMGIGFPGSPLFRDTIIHEVALSPILYFLF
jgi:hypothetical protein